MGHAGETGCEMQYPYGNFPHATFVRQAREKQCSPIESLFLKSQEKTECAKIGKDQVVNLGWDEARGAGQIQYCGIIRNAPLL
jgi:hypothetical protein